MQKNLKLKKFYLPLLLIAVVLTLCAALAACGGAPKDDSARRAAGEMRATLDCNGGKIGNYSQRDVYAKPGSLLPEPGARYKDLPAPVLGVYDDLLGWFRGEKDADGNVTFGDQWDFYQDVMPDEDITLYAKWAGQLKCVVRYGEAFEHEDAFKYISNFASEAEKAVTEPTRAPVLEGYTFISYYKDATLNTPCTFPLPYPDTAEDNTFAIYAKFIKGNYRLVYNAANLTSPIGINTNLYFMDDVDMAGAAWVMPALYNGEIVGNDKTVKNLSFGLKQQGNSNLKQGLFGTLGSARITDLSFKNVNVCLSFGLNASTIAYAGLLAGELGADTVLENVSLTGNVTVLFSIPAQNPDLRADMLRFDNESRSDGLFGEMPETADLSGITYTVKKTLIYSSPNALSAPDLTAEGYMETVLDSDGGSMGVGNPSAVYYYLKSGDRMIEPGAFPTAFAKPTKSNGTSLLTLEGWYVGTKTGGVITYGDKWDFSNGITPGLKLFAKWS